MEDQPSPETIEFIYEHTKGVAQRQWQDSDARDSKALGLVAVAGVVMAVGTPPSGATHTESVLFVLSLLSFITVALSALLCLRGSVWALTDHADNLWRLYWQSEPVEIMHKLAEEVPFVYAHNDANLQRKNKWLRLELGALTFQVVLIGLAAIVASV